MRRAIYSALALTHLIAGLAALVLGETALGVAQVLGCPAVLGILALEEYCGR